MARKKWQIDAALKLWRLTHWAKLLGGKPPFRKAAGMVASKKAFSGSFVPVGEEIEVPPSVVAPRELLLDYISRASHRTVVRECPCRVGQGCVEYPHDIGCILLGSGALDVDPSVGRTATAEEAAAHMDAALELGLLPLIGHLRIDKTIFGIKDFARFLTICFCCECCCVLRSGMHDLVSAYPDSLVRLDGVRIEAGRGCAGCGDCAAACPIENVRLDGGVAIVGDACLGCGTCTRVCPTGRLRLIIEPDADWLEDVRSRIEAGVDIEH